MSDEAKGRGPRGPSDDELRKAMPRDRAARDVRVGVFVVAGMISVLGALFLLTDPAALRGRYILVTAVQDAGGVRKGDPVLMKGVNIGRVHGFEMTTDGLVTIQMEIEGEWDNPDDSRTVLAGAGLLGGQTLEILRGTSAAIAQESDTLLGVGEQAGLLESARDVSSQAGEVLGRIQAALDEGTVDAVRGSAADLRVMLADLRALAAAQRGQLDALTASLNRTAQDLEPRSASVLARADSAAASLARTSASLDRAATALEGVLTRMDAGEGTLGRLSRDDSLYVSLDRAAAAIAFLAEDIQANPRKYVNLEVF